MLLSYEPKRGSCALSYAVSVFLFPLGPIGHPTADGSVPMGAVDRYVLYIDVDGKQNMIVQEEKEEKWF